MTLKEQISQDRIAAMKSSNKQLKDLLGTVIAESSRDENIKDQKNPTDAEMITVINKFIKNLKKCNNAVEAEMLEKYLPQMILEGQLKVIICDFITENKLSSKKDMGLIMKYLKEKFNGRYDAKLASEFISKELK